MGKTTILIEKQTREQLKTIGAKSETYDKIINRLILQELGNPETKNN